MGYRSQIYIRYNITYTRGSASAAPETCNYKGLIAKHFDWNYSAEMISRARYLISEIRYEFLTNKWFFGTKEKIRKLEAFCNVNFDERDVAVSSDILENIITTIYNIYLTRTTTMVSFSSM